MGIGCGMGRPDACSAYYGPQLGAGGLAECSAYYGPQRVLKKVDLANSGDAAQQLTTIFDDVLHGSPVVLRVKETPHGLKKLRDVFALLDTEKRHIRIDC